MTVYTTVYTVQCAFMNVFNYSRFGAYTAQYFLYIAGPIEDLRPYNRVRGNMWWFRY